MASGLKVRLAAPTDASQILSLFCALWPDEKPRGHAAHIRGILSGTARTTLPLALFVAQVGEKLIGFAEVGLRSHANGCDGVRPVGFLEGWYVAKGFRRQGVGARLVRAAEKWCRARGCREMASDTWANHRLSIAAHRALGYTVDGRYVNFRKSL
ncbi:MAG TPA: GNAT family N-acetyltransferase [Polyangiaceae bacterium]|nr:GNAT family N-acetyltransferase [Polyangiaceae bacterium]